jgi:hypothetical protein
LNIISGKVFANEICSEKEENYGEIAKIPDFKAIPVSSSLETNSHNPEVSRPRVRRYSSKKTPQSKSDERGKEVRPPSLCLHQRNNKLREDNDENYIHLWFTDRYVFPLANSR